MQKAMETRLQEVLTGPQYQKYQELPEEDQIGWGGGRRGRGENREGNTERANDGAKQGRQERGN